MNQSSTLTMDHLKEQVESCKQESEDLASKVEILINQCSSNDPATSDDTTGTFLLQLYS